MIPGSEWTCGIDLVAVERAMAGTTPRPELREREQRYTARLMLEAERTIVDTALAIGVHEKVVERWQLDGRGAS